MKLLLPLASVICLLACSARRPRDGIVRPSAPELTGHAYPISAQGDVEHVEANWKERLAQPYVYIEHVGDYRRMGDSMRQLFASTAGCGIEGAGAPFALFFDDPGRVAVGELRGRACLPVAERPFGLGSGLEFDLLPRSMVVYARVGGAYPNAARAYPALFEYLRELGWRQGGPIREVYLVNPVEARSYDELLTEIQIPWIAGG